MGYDLQYQSKMCERLRRAPSTASVKDSLPVLFFGDLLTARIATVGLNPSKQEYLDRSGNHLAGANRRFETLTSLISVSRATLTNDQCDQAIATMRDYFQPGKPIYSWFRPLGRVTYAMGYSYAQGEAVHLDLVQEATDPTWSALKGPNSTVAKELRDADLPFLKWEIESFPLKVVVCNGKTVFTEVCRLIGGTFQESGSLARITWYVASAEVNGRSIGIAGWNIPLARPTGLGTTGEEESGRLLASRLTALSCE